MATAVNKASLTCADPEGGGGGGRGSGPPPEKSQKYRNIVFFIAKLVLIPLES